jgi:cytochrome c biogenesis protein CcmG, thiol:disulfide interchange protein DsbE
LGIATGTMNRAGRVPGRAQTIIVLVLTIAGIGALSWFVTNGFDDGVTNVDINANVSVEPPTIGKAPTGFSGLAYDGKAIALADYAGKAVWLNFGASWCRDCRVEAADLEATYEKYKGQGLNVLAVFINEPASDIATYARRAGLTFPIVTDQTTKIASAYRLVGIPTHIFIGRDGLIRDIKIGALSKDDMEKAVTALLN